MAIDDSLTFALDSSLVDLIERQIPNFISPSDRWLEAVVDGSVQLYSVDAGAPPIRRENSNIYLEPSTVNLISHNIDLTHSSWVKGTDVNVDRDARISPSNQLMADELTFTGGDASPSAQARQTISKTLQLEVGQEHTLTGYLALGGGRFAQGDTNVIQVTGAVVDPDSAKFYLYELNESQDKYQKFEINFKTTGQQISDVPADDDELELTIVSFLGNEITVTLPGAVEQIAADSFAGGQIEIIELTSGTSILYPIESHTGTATPTSSFTITLPSTANLDNDGIDNTWTVYILEAEKVEVTIEIYATSIAQILWGGIFLEARTFPTSPIYQDERVLTREGVDLVFRNSPIAGLDTFAFLIELQHWRGDGNIVNAGNFALTIENRQLVMTVQGVTLTTPMPSSATILVQVSTPSGVVKLYLNGVLSQTVALSGFTGDLEAVMTFTSAGVRDIRRCFVFNSVLLDGQIPVGAIATDEVAEVFNNPNILPSNVVVSIVPEFVLPPIEVPSRSEPDAESMITAVSTNTVTVLSLQGDEEGGSGGYSVSSPYSIIRGIRNQNHKVVATGVITAINTSQLQLTLSDAGGAMQGDFLVQGDIESPGLASARFPYEPIDEQEITLITPDASSGYWLTLNEGSTSFTISRAFVQSQTYESMAQVSVEEIDAIGGRIRVDRVDNVSQGDFIVQPKPGKEMVLSTACYLASLRYPVPNISIGEDNGLYSNGVVISNYNVKPTTVEVVVQVFL